MIGLVNKQRFALNLGLFVMAFHILFSLLLWFVLEFPDERVFIKEISTPVTTGYAIGIIKYYLDTRGIVTSVEVIGIRLVIMVFMVVGVFCASLLVAPIIYHHNASITSANLNSFFLLVESAFAGLISLIFSFLYGTETAESIHKSE